jgi:hypothetical protein
VDSTAVFAGMRGIGYRLGAPDQCTPHAVPPTADSTADSTAGSPTDSTTTTDAE